MIYLFIFGLSKSTPPKEGSSKQSRHFERATVMVKFAVLRLFVACYLVSTQFMIADVFTKATDEVTFLAMRAVLRNEPKDTLRMKAMRIARRARSCFM